MTIEMRKVEVRPEGIFLIGTKRLSLSGFKARRTRLENELLDLRDEQRNLEQTIKHNSRRIQHLEEQLATFNSDEILAWVRQREYELELEQQRKKQERIIANNKAKAFLREYLGKERYEQLTKQGHLDFRDKIGRSHRLDSKGNLYRNDKRICTIRPRELPLPDFILSLLTTAKEGRI